MTKKTETTIALGKNLRAARQAAGLSVMEAAVAIGSIPTSIYKWESGERVPTEENKAHAARAYGCTVAAFYG